MNRPVLVLVVALVFGSCSLPLALPTPTLQAPGFQYIERNRLEGAMWKLADGITALEVLFDDEREGEIPRQQVLDVLSEMEAAASTVSSPGQTTNHPAIDREMPRFLLDLAAAKAAINAEPPRYQPAEDLSLACVRCHRSQR